MELTDVNPACIVAKDVTFLETYLGDVLGFREPLTFTILVWSYPVASGELRHVDHIVCTIKWASDTIANVVCSSDILEPAINDEFDLLPGMCDGVALVVGLNVTVPRITDAVVGLSTGLPQLCTRERPDNVPAEERAEATVPTDFTSAKGLRGVVSSAILPL